MDAYYLWGYETSESSVELVREDRPFDLVSIASELNPYTKGFQSLASTMQIKSACKNGRLIWLADRARCINLDRCKIVDGGSEEEEAVNGVKLGCLWLNLILFEIRQNNRRRLYIIASIVCAYKGRLYSLWFCCWQPWWFCVKKYISLNKQLNKGKTTQAILSVHK